MTATKKHPKPKIDYHNAARWPRPVGRSVPAKFQGADSPAVQAKARAAISVKQDRLMVERAKIDQRLGVKPGAKKISTRKRAAIHAHMQPFAFTAEKVRAEVL